MPLNFAVNYVNIPCVIDGDTEFGEAVNVLRMVNGMEKAGITGVHIEDRIAFFALHINKIQLSFRAK